MNNITITGRLVKDPELRTSASGLSVCSFSVAVDRPMAKEKAVDYFDCVAFRKSAEFVNKYFFKGKPILIQGHMQSRDWQDRNGNKRRSWELICENIEFCGGDKKQAAPEAVSAAPVFTLESGTDDLPWVDNEQFDALPV